MRKIVLSVLVGTALACTGCWSNHSSLHTYRFMKTWEREIHPDIDLFLVW